jgi:heme O synthase-like polyprenyltransferase
MLLSRAIDDVMDAISTQQRATVRAQLASPTRWLIVAGAGLVAGFVTWFVGGTLIAGLAAAPAGVIAAVVLTWWDAGSPRSWLNTRRGPTPTASRARMRCGRR